MTGHVPMEFVVLLDGDAISDRRLNEITIQLKSELEQLHLVQVDLVREVEKPDGTMSGDAFTLGAIALAVLPVTVPALIEFLRDWKLRNSNRTITIKRRIGEQEIEVTVPEDISPSQLKDFIDTVTVTITPSTD